MAKGKVRARKRKRERERERDGRDKLELGRSWKDMGGIEDITK